MKIFDEIETITYLIKNKCSIARYGDGELKLCTGRSAKSQSFNEGISSRLRQILLSNDTKCLVGIPRIYNRADWPTVEKGRFWGRYSGVRYSGLYNSKKRYGSAFITRPDTNRAIDCKCYFDLVKQLWVGRHVFLVQGADTNFDKTGTMFNAALSVKVLRGPAKDAYSDYPAILARLLEDTCADDIIVLALGPTATIIAYELSIAGRQALDLGHLGQFYSHVHPKDTGTQYD